MELLVGMTIFITIMASVTLMFNAVVRTTKIGYQNQTAYEVARGVFSIIEQDVTRAFTSRETGLKDTFYGTPYGFTFIGMIDANGDGNFNLARITYVLYANNNNTNDPLRIVHQSAADDNVASADRVTYSLLRYIEPGVDNLESFPINWNTIFDDDNLGAGFNIQAGFINPAILAAAAICDGTSECNEAVTRAIKCELWIRMLAGDITAPRFWGAGSPARSGAILSVATLDPADYVLAENILHISRGNNFDPNDYSTYTRLDDTFDGTNDSFLDFTVDMALVDLTQSTQGYSDYLAYDGGAFMSRDYMFSYREYDAEYFKLSGNSRIPLVDSSGEWVYVRDSNGNVVFVPDTDEWDGNWDGNPEPLPVLDTTLAARDFSFWNDSRNLEFNVGVTGVATAANVNPALTENIISTTPDLLDPALPESIQIQFTLFYPSPYAGAPDFEKTFTHQIDLPTAYRRKQESLLTKQQRAID